MKTNKHIMLDLETLGTSANAAIVSIGAVVFDTTGTHNEFSRAISVESTIASGGIVDPSTLLWWFEQSEAARQFWLHEPVDLVSALNSFILWIPEGAYVWGNGASFDNVILGNAYKRTKLKQPWKYSKDMCYRTMKNIAPQIQLQRYGVHHNALADATSQALHLIEIYKHLGLTL